MPPCMNPPPPMSGLAHAATGARLAIRSPSPSTCLIMRISPSPASASAAVPVEPWIGAGTWPLATQRGLHLDELRAADRHGDVVDLIGREERGRDVVERQRFRVGDPRGDRRA